jgi:hypothetical protein
MTPNKLSIKVLFNGNAFRYRATVTAKPGNRIGRFAYDVYLVSE